MAVNNTRVREIINDAIKNVSDGGDACCGKFHAAWQSLKAWRDLPPAPGQTPNSLDLEYAAAENYMYARWIVCAGHARRTQMNALALGYYATKLVGQKMPTSGNPQSKPDRGVLRWGNIGAQEGEADRDRCNPGVKPPLWVPVERLMPMQGPIGKALAKPGTSYKK